MVKTVNTTAIAVSPAYVIRKQESVFPIMQQMSIKHILMVS